MFFLIILSAYHVTRRHILNSPRLHYMLLYIRIFQFQPHSIQYISQGPSNYSLTNTKIQHTFDCFLLKVLLYFFYNLLNTKEISKIITFTRLGFPVIYVTGLSMLVITCNTTPSIVYITINCIIRQVFVTSATPRGTTSTVIFRKPWTFRFYK